jgi:hypothetical protein
MRHQFAVVGMCAGAMIVVAGASFGQGAADQSGASLQAAGIKTVQVSKTEAMDFPAGGTLRIENSTGDINIEGWDQPGIEITTIKSSKNDQQTENREKTLKELGRVEITAKRNGNELVIATQYPHHQAPPYLWPLSRVTNFDLEYDIKLPRNAKIVVRHDAGNIYLDEITGDVDAQARQGQITLRLTGDTPRAIDAKSVSGSINSDFPGQETRKVFTFGHQFVDSPSAAQSLHLRIGFGDIILLKAHDPRSTARAAVPQNQK